MSSTDGSSINPAPVLDDPVQSTYKDSKGNVYASCTVTDIDPTPGTEVPVPTTVHVDVECVPQVPPPAAPAGASGP